MLRRTGFKKPQRERQPLPAPRPVRQTAPISFAVVGQPKGEKAKPGKRTPTAEESRWMAAIVEFGRIACYLDGVAPRPTAVHHIVEGGRRLGHLHTLGLCDPGHHQGGQALGLVSRHPWKSQFEEKYGTEKGLLILLQEKLGITPIKKS